MPVPMSKGRRTKTSICSEPEQPNVLFGDLWPVHLKPRSDELLSSWLIRFAHAHLIKSETICTMLLGRQSPIWNRDVDRLAPEKLLEQLSRISGTSFERVWQTTLASYAGWLSETVNNQGNSRWILPLGVFHRDRIRPGLMYCPLCLAEENGAYFRRLWRVAWATTCTKHQCQLNDSCPKCGAFIEPHRSDMFARQVVPANRTIVTCHRCSALLSKANIVSIDSEFILFQSMLEHCLDRGFIDWADNPTMYSIQFFDGLRSLLGGLTTGRAKELTQSPLILNLRGVEFEHCALSDRHQLMQLCMQLMKDWPHEFLNYVGRVKLRASDLLPSSIGVPYWYSQVVKSISQHHAPLLIDEAMAIHDAAQRIGFKASNAALRKLSGRDVATLKNFNRKPKKQMSAAEFESAMLKLDHDIATITDRRKRGLILRTKFMLTAYYHFQLSYEQLVRLTIEDVKQLVSPIPEARFFSPPEDNKQAAAWMVWYWNKIRPTLIFCPNEKSIFTSFRTGIRLTAEGARIWINNCYN